MRTVLTINNCHRAAIVRLVANPEAGEWDWKYNAIKKNGGFFAQIESQAVNKSTGESRAIRNNSDALKEWEVVSWAYERNFEDLYQIARDAFYCTSHSPEERGLQYIRSYEATLNEDLAKMPESMHQEYYEKFRTKIIDLFSKHSRIMSSAITGPARFPTEKNRNANDVYDRASREFYEWRERQLKRAQAAIEAAKPQEEKDNEAWLSIKGDIDRSSSTIFQIDTKKVRGYDRALFVSNLAGRLTTLSKKVSPEIIAKAMAYVKELGLKMKEKGGKEIFTSRHKVWKLEEEATARREAEAERAEKENVEIKVTGATVVKCYSEDRLRIFHDERPSREIIDQLKKHGFRWSPANGCWQRQLTHNSAFAAAHVLLGSPSGSQRCDEVRELTSKIWNA